MKEQTAWVRLPIKNAFNVRELGGYPVNGGQTAYGRFLRADSLHQLCEEDIRFLKAYGVRTVIDLRSSAERMEKPENEIVEKMGAVYHHMPLFEDVTSADAETRGSDVRLWQIYQWLLGMPEKLLPVLECMADAPEGCVVFHCAAGKDRTGIIAMLLLLLAGAEPADCVTNYMQSEMNLRRSRAWRNQPEYEKYHRFLSSAQEDMEACCEWMEEKWDGVEDYLQKGGMRRSSMEKLKMRLICPL